MLKPGWKTSEFWVRVIGGATCAGLAYFNISADLYSIIAILFMIEGYAWSRFFLKKSHAEAMKEILENDPKAKEEILNVLGPILDKAMVGNSIKKTIIKKVIENGVNKL